MDSLIGLEGRKGSEGGGGVAGGVAGLVARVGEAGGEGGDGAEPFESVGVSVRGGFEKGRGEELSLLRRGESGVGEEERGELVRERGEGEGVERGRGKRGSVRGELRWPEGWSVPLRHRSAPPSRANSLSNSGRVDAFANKPVCGFPLLDSAISTKQATMDTATPATAHPLRPYYVAPPVEADYSLGLNSSSLRPPPPQRYDSPAATAYEDFGGNPAAGQMLRAFFTSSLLSFASTALVMPFEVGKTLAQVQWVPRDNLQPLVQLSDQQSPPEEAVDVSIALSQSRVALLTTPSLRLADRRRSGSRSILLRSPVSPHHLLPKSQSPSPTDFAFRLSPSLGRQRRSTGNEARMDHARRRARRRLGYDESSREMEWRRMVVAMER